MSNKRKIYWITGTITAFTGVLMVRILALQTAGRLKLPVMFGGYMLAIAGLFIITLGTRRK
ncbi:hypothetical protein IT084_08105 [Desulfallas sp. Bu1-1]|uniref:hypothetical protein n=1 Tax=Desulfallas sp. Bu1-1 TaxID=2787620 RepID=UPI00189CFCCA|nr:hypothetical protein [Desulfallas sp. Bu1-1]MBF7082936.1 hypothetical protein [Desulfallas sp. Bu1-1]